MNWSTCVPRGILRGTLLCVTRRQTWQNDARCVAIKANAPTGAEPRSRSATPAHDPCAAAGACKLPCTRRLKAYRGVKGGIAFSPRDGYYDQHLELPCGQCIDCRLRRARDWALRMVHESREHERNCFITLTYDDEHVPEDHSIDVRTWQLFAKRARRRLGGFRFFHVGEYGERSLRPHYHACIFGQDFSTDRDLWKRDGGFPLFTSKLLSELWPYGYHLIGDLSFDSACYVARYVTKKINGKAAAAAYQRVDPSTGEVWNVKPEYATMSRRPGIGRKFFQDFHEEIYGEDVVVSRGRKFRPPRYYDKLLETADKERHEQVLKGRRQVARQVGRSTDQADRARERILSTEMALKQDALNRG